MTYLYAHIVVFRVIYLVDISEKEKMPRIQTSTRNAKIGFKTPLPLSVRVVGGLGLRLMSKI